MISRLAVRLIGAVLIAGLALPAPLAAAGGRDGRDRYGSQVMVQGGSRGGDRYRGGGQQGDRYAWQGRNDGRNRYGGQWSQDGQGPYDGRNRYGGQGRYDGSYAGQGRHDGDWRGDRYGWRDGNGYNDRYRYYGPRYVYRYSGPGYYYGPPYYPPPYYPPPYYGPRYGYGYGYAYRGDGYNAALVIGGMALGTMLLLGTMDYDYHH